MRQDGDGTAASDVDGRDAHPTYVIIAGIGDGRAAPTCASSIVTGE